MKSLALRGSFLLGLILVVGGCTSVSDAGYFWGKYPYTFLETIRNPSTEATENHIAELRKIVDYSMENGLKPLSATKTNKIHNLVFTLKIFLWAQF